MATPTKTETLYGKKLTRYPTNYARKAIEVKFLGPTNTKGARVKATAEGISASVTVSYHGEDFTTSMDAYYAAAARLAAFLNWSGKYMVGALADGRYVFVCVEDSALAFEVK